MTRLLMRLLPLMLLAVLAFPLSGCAEFLAAMPKVVSVVQDAILIVDQIESFTTRYFKAHPNPEKEASVAKAMSRARSALIASQRAASGGDRLGKEQTLAAIADFQAAYQELLQACAGIPGFSVGEGMFSGSGDGIVVPEPLAMKQFLLEE